MKQKRGTQTLVICPAGIDEERIKQNPGYKLFQWLQHNYPHSNSEKSPTWLAGISEDFNMNILESVIYESSLLMVLRHLIVTADWYRRQFENTNVDFEDIFETKCLKNHFSFGSTKSRELSNLAFNAMRTSRQDITKSTKKKLHQTYEFYKNSCYLCGGEIDYKNNNSFNYLSLDHIWPQSLGGSSDEYNLNPACKKCNENRQEIVCFSDIHYEHFNIRTPKDDASYSNEFKWHFRFGVIFRALCKCELCGGKISSSGGIDFQPREDSQALSAFNSMVVCKRCSNG